MLTQTQIARIEAEVRRQLRAHAAVLQQPETARQTPRPRSPAIQRRLDRALACKGEHTGAIARHEDGMECNVRVQVISVGPLGGLTVDVQGKLCRGKAAMSAKTFEKLRYRAVFETPIWLDGHSGWTLSK